MGVIYCTRAAFATMKKRDYGYIVNINSIGGHFIPFPTENVPSYNIYSASKYGVTATNEVLRQELATSEFGEKIRITSISPGEVKTDMVEASGFPGTVDEYFSCIPYLLPEDIAESVIYVLSTPSRANVTELMIRPTAEKVWGPSVTIWLNYIKLFQFNIHLFMQISQIATSLASNRTKKNFFNEVNEVQKVW